MQGPAPAWVRSCRDSHRQDQVGSLAEAMHAAGQGPHEGGAGPKCPILLTRTGMVAVQACGPQLAQQEFPSLGGGATPDRPAAAVPQPVPTQAPHSNGPSSLHGHRAQDPVANWQPSRGDMQGEVWGRGMGDGLYQCQASGACAWSSSRAWCLLASFAPTVCGQPGRLGAKALCHSCAAL